MLPTRGNMAHMGHKPNLRGELRGIMYLEWPDLLPSRSQRLNSVREK